MIKERLEHLFSGTVSIPIFAKREKGREGMDVRGEIGYDTSSCVDNWDDPPVRWTVVMIAASLISGEINVARRRK